MGGCTQAENKNGNKWEEDGRKGGGEGEGGGGGSGDSNRSDVNADSAKCRKGARIKLCETIKKTISKHLTWLEFCCCCMLFAGFACH